MRLKGFLAIPGLLLFNLICSFAFSEELSEATSTSPSMIKTAGVPPGFQFLLEKQTTAIDVFYGDVYITTTLASYTPTTVEFHNPEEVVSGLTNLISPQQVAMGLSGEIDSHSGEVCYRDEETDCGIISPDAVGIIFDEGRFRADIFINPNLLSVQQVDMDRYLPESTSEYSTINNLTLLFSGGDNSGDILSLGGQSLFSMRQQRVISNWYYADLSGVGEFGMETLYWQMDKAEHQFQAGWFDSDTRFLSFVPNLTILGGRYSTSLKARTDLNFASGTPIQLYLSSRSRINIFREGRFIATGFYNPGNQVLDTSLLPDGAYEIELRIVDSVGREERINRYFVKTQRMPPFDQDLYFLEGGDVQSTILKNGFPQSLKTPIIDGGYSHRLTDEMSLSTAGMLTQSQLLAEAGVYYLEENFDLDPKVMMTSDGSYGWALSGYLRMGEWGAYASARRIWANQEYNPLDIDSEFDLVPYSLKQHSIGVSRFIWEGNLQARYSVATKSGRDTTEILGLAFGKSIMYAGNAFYITSEISKGDEAVIRFSLDWNMFSGNVNHAVNSSVMSRGKSFGSGNVVVGAGYSGGWYDEDLRPEDISVQWNVHGDNENTFAGLSSDVRNAFVNSSFGLNMNEGDNDSTINYSGMLSTVVGTEQSSWGVGGQQGAQGALLIEVQSDSASESGYDLFIDNNSYGQVYPGQKVAVTVLPYRTYTVRLADRNTDYVSFSDKAKRVTIYPGNVKALKWEAKSVGILVGRVVRKIPGCFDDNDSKCWDPLVFARAKNVNDSSATDGDGYIQAEVFRSSKTFSLLKKGQECKVDFSNMRFEDGLAYSEDDLKCYDVDTSDSQL